MPACCNTVILHRLPPIVDRRNLQSDCQETTIAPGGGAAAIIGAFIISLAPRSCWSFHIRRDWLTANGYYQGQQKFSRAGSLLLKEKMYPY
jgi:hypothetical protein